MLERLVGLPRVRVLAVDDAPLRVHVETRLVDLERCRECDTQARVKDRDRVPLTDLPCFGRRAILVWHKRRWRCPAPSCPTSSWTEIAPAIAASRLRLTDRAGRWVTYQIDCHGRTVAAVAQDSAATAILRMAPERFRGPWWEVRADSGCDRRFRAVHCQICRPRRCPLAVVRDLIAPLCQQAVVRGVFI
jgi:transposase